MKRMWVALAAGLAVLGSAVGVSASAGAADRPDPETIVRVTGDAATGFGVQRLDGSAVFPPTDSEARAECTEYDRRWQRARCFTEVRVWYRDLAELRRSLRWARSQQ
ncbi:hypothetical protein [Nocardioides sp. GXQ0305]|uniref:hypothetical protein n=1 Tax=Nocardioides sp. GXQ0305 TaxID=3423912 RepID=UPI003D7DDC17